jgi:hypothetical protein
MFTPWFTSKGKYTPLLSFEERRRIQRVFTPGG